MKRKIIGVCLIIMMMMGSAFSYADAAVGDVIVSLGDDLTDSEKNAILDEFNPPEDATMIVTTNAEEHEYLGDLVPFSKIGNNAISSVMITYTEEGSGINVKTSEKITYITDSIYTNALITAGVLDADIKVTAPKNASGTAALTGIMKAYEMSKGEMIDEDIKKIANEEMIFAAELSEQIGERKASDLINGIKQKIAENKPETKEEVRDIILNAANSLELNLTDEQVEKLVSLFDRMRTLDIDWDNVISQIKNIANKASDYLSSEEGQGFLQKLKLFLVALIDWIASLFK